ncbi:neuferricin isoform X2 [Mauremys mutica]|uniref:neuferricin isoform X2 n=1 Tax=Mauremys mutica TaxID=74926 RepID=UPI001D16F49F|nr:neuferricin isoform X2 [Mauremys mutica]
MGLAGLLVPALGLAAAWLLGLGFEPSSWLLPFFSGRGRLLSPAELARHTGAPGSPGLYLALLGQVFDVRRGHRQYGPGAAYSVFAGKLVGRFYDENGAPTKALEQAKAVIEEALKFKEQNNEKKQFPPCNSEWSSTSGSRFWCSKQSGGVNRDWIGVPRMLYKAGSSDSHCVCVRTTGPPSGQLDSTEHSDRGDLDNPNLQEYKGCHPLADWCVLKD